MHNVLCVQYSFLCYCFGILLGVFYGAGYDSYSEVPAAATPDRHSSYQSADQKSQQSQQSQSAAIDPAELKTLSRSALQRLNVANRANTKPYDVPYVPKPQMLTWKPYQPHPGLVQRRCVGVCQGVWLV